MKKAAVAFSLPLATLVSSVVLAQEGANAALLQQQIDALRQQLILQNQQLFQLQQQLSATQSPSGISSPVAAGGMTDRVEGEQRSPQQGRSTEDLLLEQHNVFDRKFSLEAGLTYTYYDRKDLIFNGFLVLDAIFLGQVDVDRIRAHQWTADLTGRYTFNDRWQAELQLPYLYRYSHYYSVGKDGDGRDGISEHSLNEGGLGDISAAVFYRLLTETVTSPDLVWNLRVKAPTGRDPYGIPEERVGGDESNLTVPTELPTGNGLWALSTGFSAVKTLDPAIIFASINYTHHLERSFDDISAAEGNQPGKVRLGDAFGYGLGMAFALNERLSLSMNFNQQFGKEAEQHPDGGDKIKIAGSDSNSASLGMGVTWAMTDKLSLVVNWAAGLTPDAPDYVVGIRLPYRF